MTFRLLSYNIRRGGVGREQLIAGVIRACAPDVVILQEATRPAAVARMAGEAGLPCWGAEDGRSLAFMSRIPVVRHAWSRPRGSKHAFLELALEAPAPPIFGVHLSAVHSYVTERRRVLELRALLAAIRDHRAGAHVVAGDFNTLAPGAALQVRRLPVRLRPAVWATGGAIRWATIRAMLDAGYVDAYRAVQPTEPGYTFPAWDPHLRLDYVFLPARIAGSVRHCDVVTQAPGVLEASDHLPLLADLSMDEQEPVLPGP